MEQEVRIFYIRLANELNDLAALHIPCNLLYDRFDPVIEHLEPVDNRSAKEKESAAAFSFQDPRLMHLKPNYTREQLQLNNISFVNNPSAFKAALDEIIKYNNFVNEYNYCQEFYSRLQNDLMRKMHLPDFESVFIKYDKDHDDLLTKEEFQQMMIDAGMKYVTFAEASYTFNLFGGFKPRMNLQMFKERLLEFKGSC